MIAESNIFNWIWLSKILADNIQFAEFPSFPAAEFHATWYFWLRQNINCTGQQLRYLVCYCTLWIDVIIIHLFHALGQQHIVTVQCNLSIVRYWLTQPIIKMVHIQANMFMHMKSFIKGTCHYRKAILMAKFVNQYKIVLKIYLGYTSGSLLVSFIRLINLPIENITAMNKIANQYKMWHKRNRAKSCLFCWFVTIVWQVEQNKFCE